MKATGRCKTLQGGGMSGVIEILLVEDGPGDVRLTREALRDGKVRNHLHVVPDGGDTSGFAGGRAPGGRGEHGRPDHEPGHRHAERGPREVLPVGGVLEPQRESAR
jgi:hypothetical protein